MGYLYDELLILQEDSCFMIASVVLIVGLIVTMTGLNKILERSC